MAGMMIKTKKELKFYIYADRMMNRGYFKTPFLRRLRNIIYPDKIMLYLEYMRKVEYYSQQSGVKLHYYKWKYYKLGLKLGFTIGTKVFGYGLVIPHYGTIVVGNSNRIGNFCVLNTSICISDNSKEIGDGFYVSTGSKITSHLTLGNNISTGANTVVNKSFEEDNRLLVGMPAFPKKEMAAWYIRDGKRYSDKVKSIEDLKSRWGL